MGGQWVNTGQAYNPGDQLVQIAVQPGLTGWSAWAGESGANGQSHLGSANVSTSLVQYDPGTGYMRIGFNNTQTMVIGFSLILAA